MRDLFVHQNFPGQFRYVAKVLAEDPANIVIGVGEAGSLKGRAALHPAIRVLSYQPHGHGHKETHHYLRDYESHIRRGQSAVRLLLKLRDEEGFQPVSSSPTPAGAKGYFSRTSFRKPRSSSTLSTTIKAPWVTSASTPSFPSTLDDHLRVRIKNSTQLQSLVACDQGISPTKWQQSRYPTELPSKTDVQTSPESVQIPLEFWTRRRR